MIWRRRLEAAAPAGAQPPALPRRRLLPALRRFAGVLPLLAVFRACSAEQANKSCLGDDGAREDGGPFRQDAPYDGEVLGSRQCSVMLQSASGVAVKLRSWGQAMALRGEDEDDADRSNITCRTTVLASQIQPGTACPNSCPFWAELVGDHLCQFQCVTSSECGTIDPNATVADNNGMYCRPCMVPGCDQCNVGGGDFCLRCRAGYSFFQGHCLSHYRFGWYAFYTVILLIVVYLIWWYGDLRSKEIKNQAGLEQGQRFRSRTRLHQPQEGDLPRELWPLSTNLLKEQVAGPGLAQFFNFQLAVISWAAVMAAGWVILSLAVSTDLLTLGTKKAATPQQLCTVTTWGFKTQHDLMWAKVSFMYMAYHLTFAGCIVHAALQHRRYEVIDDEATMKDYAALVTELPEVRGDNPEAEDELKESLEQAIGCAEREIVGVCICWDFVDKADDVMSIIESDTERTQRQRPSFSMQALPFALSSSGQDVAAAAAGAAPDEQKRGCQALSPFYWARKSFDALNATLGFQDQEQQQPRSSGSLNDLDQTMMKKRMRRRTMASVREVDILEGLVSTDQAFVVFATEEARDRAVEVSRRRQGLKLSGSETNSSDSDDSTENESNTCFLQAVTFEPETVKWTHFSTKNYECLLRLFIGVLLIALALFLWTLCCYLPYALYVTSFSYARGDSPSSMATLTFTMLVVAGNQTMYFVCRAVAEAAKFRCKDTTEMAYMTLYFLACLVNFVMDMAVTSYTTYIMMVGMNARTASGRSLEDLSGLEIFESYPMQRALGHFFFWYAFPSCFLIPFLVEPIFAIWLPGHIMELLVRSHPNVRGMEAERRLQFFSIMDLSRYSDCLLNVNIAVMAFLFPGSYIWKMFLSLFASHVFIIGLDHYRVLRAVPACQFSTNASEHCAQALSAIPVGMLAACVVLKYHCLDGTPRISDSQILSTMFTAFLGHIFMHWLILAWIVPLFGRDHEHTPVTYAEVSKRTPCSWFSANPVHCLRSRYIHCHTPPCDFYFLGKEHLLQPNPKIGIYFQSAAAAVSDDDEEGKMRSSGPAAWMSSMLSSRSLRRTNSAASATSERRRSSVDSLSDVFTGLGLASWLSPTSASQEAPMEASQEADDQADANAGEVTEMKLPPPALRRSHIHHATFAEDLHSEEEEPVKR